MCREPARSELEIASGLTLGVSSGAFDGAQFRSVQAAAHVARLSLTSRDVTRIYVANYNSIYGSEG